MRIEELYTIKTTGETTSKKEIFFKDFKISGSTITVHENMWTVTISNDDKLNEMINNGKIITQIYDDLGNEVGSGYDFMTKIGSDGITISCISPFTHDLTLRVFGVVNDEEETSDLKYQKFLITPDDVIADEAGWNFLIEQDDLDKIVLLDGSVEVLIYNKNGVDVTTSPLLITTITSSTITIKSIVGITSEEVYSVIVKQD